MTRLICAAFGGACVGVGLMTMLLTLGPSAIGMLETVLGCVVIVATMRL